jgi:hypothetical protein
LRVPGGEFGADRVPGKPEEFDPILGRGGRRLLGLVDQGGELRIGEILDRRRQQIIAPPASSLSAIMTCAYSCCVSIWAE